MNKIIIRATYKKPVVIDMFSVDELEILALLARKGVFEICLNADNGHIGGSSSSVELFVALYFGGVLRFNPSNPGDPNRDRVLVRGHLGPLRYKIFSWLGWLKESELLTYRRMGSRLCGHENHLVTPGIDLSPSGSLGMILSYGVGATLGARNAGSLFRTFVFLGDGEEQEGMVSEAARHAAHLQLGNLVAIIDRNKKQLSNPVSDTDSASLFEIWKGYGWRVLLLQDGHNIEATLEKYREALAETQITGQPVLIIADTIKGFGLDGAIEHFSGYHTIGRLKNETVMDAIRMIDERLNQRKIESIINKLDSLKGLPAEAHKKERRWEPISLSIVPNPNTPNHPDDCQFDYFKKLRQLVDKNVISRSDLYFLTADVTTKELVSKLELDKMFHFYNVGIREQHMIAMAHGLSITQPQARILINSFDAFTYRSLDQINAALQGYSSMIIIGDVSGITNSRNGKTHQTTGLPAALLSMNGLTFLEPWDAVDTFACFNWALGESRRVVYIRVCSTSAIECQGLIKERSITYYVVRDVEHNPDITLIGSGFTVNSCIEAAIDLQADGIESRIINVINPNSLDDGFRSLIANDKPLLTVYNGHPRVLRQAVADAVLLGNSRPSKINGLGFTIGSTGTFSEMQEWTGLGAKGVVGAAKNLLKN